MFCCFSLKENENGQDLGQDYPRLHPANNKDCDAPRQTDGQHLPNLYYSEDSEDLSFAASHQQTQTTPPNLKSAALLAERPPPHGAPPGLRCSQQPASPPTFAADQAANEVLLAQVHSFPSPPHTTCHKLQGAGSRVPVPHAMAICCARKYACACAAQFAS